MRLILAVLCLLALAWPAHADNKTIARERYRTATQHYDLGEYREALVDFKEAYRNYEEPSFLFNIGQCHRQLGEKELALRFFRTYLGKVPNAVNREEVRDMMTKLEASLQQERAASTAPPQGTIAPETSPTEPKEPTTPPAATVTPTPEPPPPTATPAVTLTQPAPPPPARTPVYKKWWLWTAVAVVAVGVGVGLGVGLTQSAPAAPGAATEFGTFRPF
jgi:tetratricopeptide (TPR) repeat protein